MTTTNKLEAGPAAKGRDNEGQMRRSHVCFFGLVATCDVRGTCPTQKLPLFFNLIQMTTKKQISYFGDPQTGEVYKNQLKNRRRKKNISSFVRGDYVPGVYHTHVQKSHSTRYFVVHSGMGRSLVSLSRVVGTPA